MTADQPRTAGSEQDLTTCRIGARRVSRSFGPVLANINVDLTVRPGTVHAVIGENGAGKSTLMRMLYGLDQPNQGTIVIDDSPVELNRPTDGLRYGIGLVQQELAIIGELTLLENLVLGAEPVNRGRIDWTTSLARAHALARDVGVEIDWDVRAEHTPMAVQQQVEILRLLYRGARVLILDEPTAVLAPAQTDELLRMLADLRTAGRTVVFISHKLDEVLTIADEITVMRAGRTVTTLARADVDRASLTKLIVGEAPLATSESEEHEAGAPVLTLDNVSADDARGIARLKGVTLTIKAGEIVGVAGVTGNGQEELAEVAVGTRRATAGRIVLYGNSDDEDVTRASVRSRRAHGMAYVSADRKHEGLALVASLTDNCLPGPQLSTVGRRGWLGKAAVRRFVDSVLNDTGVRYGKSSDPASSLSGGNQQRLVLGREMASAPTVIIASQPTRGVDLRGINYIHALLRQARNRGAGVLLLSEEIDELRELSDRIIVLFNGRISGELPAGAGRSEIGELMLGEGGGRHDDSA